MNRYAHFTLAGLHNAGWNSAVADRWTRRTNPHEDLKRFGDVLAARPGKPSLLIIRSTSVAKLAICRARALAEHQLWSWLAIGGQFELWGWSRCGDPGQPREWAVQREVVLPSDDLPWPQPWQAEEFVEWSQRMKEELHTAAGQLLSHRRAEVHVAALEAIAGKLRPMGVKAVYRAARP